MKIFRKPAIAFSITLAAIAFTGCDNISEEDRFIELPKVEASRVVLLEEFTGQKCINCPEAHEKIADLLKQYPENLITVSFHAGGDAFSFGEGQFPGLVGLRTEESESYASDFNVKSFPAGVVNRATGVQSMYQWEGTILTEMAKPSDIEISTLATYSVDDNKISISTTINPYQNLTPNLLLYVVENGIVAPQTKGTAGYDMEYVHNHVFRTAVNGHDGEVVTLVTRQPATFSHEIVVKDNWDVNNLEIVAFAFDSNGILQATSSEVVVPVTEL